MCAPPLPLFGHKGMLSAMTHKILCRVLYEYLFTVAGNVDDSRDTDADTDTDTDTVMCVR